jgi:hypothetical protein
MAAGVSALSVVGLFTAKPLLAQIKAALVQSVDEPARNPYQDGATFSQGSGCSGTFCNVYFATVPAGKRLVITNVTGVVYVVSPGVLQPLNLVHDGASAPAMPIPTVLQAGTFPGPLGQQEGMFGVNAPVRIYFDAGTAPHLLASASSSIAGDTGYTASQIFLSGYYVSVP